MEKTSGLVWPLYSLGSPQSSAKPAGEEASKDVLLTKKIYLNIIENGGFVLCVACLLIMVLYSSVRFGEGCLYSDKINLILVRLGSVRLSLLLISLCFVT